MEKITVEDGHKICCLCHRSTVDELKFGPLYSRKDITCHYFCILFTSNLKQQGKSDKDGILGFLPVDIKSEITRVSQPRLTKIYNCAYCDEKNPTIGCCNRRCNKVWHFPCGLENGATFQFFGNHESYCTQHAKTKSIPTVEDHVAPECPICLRKIENSNNDPAVFGTCCKRATFHKDCIQRFALSAGYFFKCPCCTSKEIFTLDVQKQGVYVPNQDASWEVEPNAFQELLFAYNKCDASACECPKGRHHQQDRGPWRLFRCTDCGAAATHVKCDKEVKTEPWYCSLCREAEEKFKQQKRLKLSVEQPSSSSTVRNRQARKKVQRPASRRASSSRANFAKITIADYCKDYFPFTRKQIIQFGKEMHEFPDWGMKRLSVNLVDCLSPAEPMQQRKAP